MWFERICLASEPARFEHSGDEAENLFALRKQRFGFLWAEQIGELRDFELREHFGSGPFRDQIETLGVFLRPTLIAFGDIAWDRECRSA